MKTKTYVKKPCQGCKYFDVCGNSARTEVCEGREIGRKKKNKYVKLQTGEYYERRKK